MLIYTIEWFTERSKRKAGHSLGQKSHSCTKGKLLRSSPIRRYFFTHCVYLLRILHAVPSGTRRLLVIDCSGATLGKTPPQLPLRVRSAAPG